MTKSKDDLLCVSGEVVECLPNTMFKVKLDNGQIIMSTLSGKMRKNKIRVLQGDSVDLEISIYDITKGRIVFRYK